MKTKLRPLQNGRLLGCDESCPELFLATRCFMIFATFSAVTQEGLTLIMLFQCCSTRNMDTSKGPLFPTDRGSEVNVIHMD